MSLVLGNGVSRRRAGLSRNIGGSLLRSVNASESQNRAAMPKAVAQRATAAVKAEAVAKRAEEEEEDINRLPDSDSDNDSDEAFRQNNKEDIEGTDFISAAGKPEAQKENDKLIARERNKGAAVATKNPPTNTRPRRGMGSLVSSKSTNSPKRKGQEDLKQLGAGMVDAHGRVTVKKPRISRAAVYTRKSYQPPPPRSSDTDDDSPKKVFREGPIESPEKRDDQDSPPKKFKGHNFESPENSDVEEGRRFRHHSCSIDDSPATTPHSRPKFRPSGVAQSLEKEKSLQQPVFEDSEATIRDLMGKAQTILSTERIPRPPAPASLPIDEEEEDFQTMTQMAKCPMCGETVDPTDLRAYGRMNTRKQEKFCRSHRKTTALDTWKAEEYPTINWAKLDSRISKHHSFIKELINGADSYYRERLAETVNAGKNRSLLKSNYNPTPGYYGTRGLRAISENTMRKFTPLLKRRMVVDRLMAARGFTPYVEYVVVPEVAIKLIMEDMMCGVERAREIMSKSLEVGELLSEEVKDVVKRKGSEEIEDSDE
ncbi:hypothetical protein N431DRAFT_476589 [Stipitochalara longipes BDJ]|nr:hypothetical protein N431DRAFT_476589 [Stipitochalara longipes BDJ]